MKERLAFASLPLLGAFLIASFPLGAATPTPTPTPKGKSSRKLGGGSFGAPPATTPTPRSSSSGSLADVVRKTQDEAGAAATPASRRIVITNESLGTPLPAQGGTSVTITGRAGAKPVVRTPVPATPTPIVIPEYRDASGRTEADWKGRAAEARERLEGAESSLSAAKAEARRLENDFYAWSDGNYRERVIRPAWDQARERVANLEKEAEAARTALADLEEDARKSGTPPGWLR